MAQTADQNFIASFDAMVKQAYQGQMVLGGTVRTKRGVVGTTHRFPTLGKGVAQERIPQTDVTPMNLQHGNATATLTDFSAPEYSDIYDLSKLNFDEKKELAEAISGAMGRRMDQLVLDAMALAANATQVDQDVGGVGTGLNIEKILRAKRLMDDLGVPSDGRRYMAISAFALEQALQETEIGSSDFNVLKPLVSGEIKSWAGFNFIMINTRDEGGLAVAANIRNNFAYHADAVGLAIGLDMKTAIDWVPEKTSWLVNGIFSAGAVTIDTDGVFDVLTDES